MGADEPRRAPATAAPSAADNPSPVIVLSAEGTILYQNKAADAVILSRSGTPWLPPAWADEAMRALSEGARRTLELDHAGQTWRVSVAPLTARTSVILHAFELAAPQAARATHTLASRIIDVSNEAVLISNAQNLIVDANEAFTRQTGYELEEVRGRDPKLLSSGRHEPEFYEEMWHALESDGCWRGEILDRRKSGAIQPKLMAIHVLRGVDGEVTHHVAVFSDLSDVKTAEAKLERMAHYDSLTGLPNRALFLDRLRQTLLRSKRSQDAAALLFLDLDRFKNVNDTLGHQAGDDLLVHVARRLLESVRASDTVARLGGDEFTVILSRINDPADAGLVARKIMHRFEEPVHVAGQQLFVSSSVGIAHIPQDGDDIDALIVNADTAMYRAKSDGRNTYRAYTKDMSQGSVEKLRLETDLRQAIDRDELLLHFQPRLDLLSGRLIGAEALVRWQHPEHGLVPPLRFISLAEESGVIVPLGYQVLRLACQQMIAWREAGLPELEVAVNLSPRQFREPDLVDEILRTVERYGLDPSQIEVEVTEGSIMEDVTCAARTLSAMKDKGIKVSIDDFGTGYSSLQHLKKLPVDILKIDQSFVRDLPADSDNAAITRAIISLARTLRLAVVAEGVETPPQLSYLSREGCDQIQGYLISRPLMGATFTDLARQGSFTLPPFERT